MSGHDHDHPHDHSHDHDHGHRHDGADRWKHDGVRVIPGDQLDP
ncbi:MAG: mannose-6-phosphate isomerase, partial [Tardiphaga sp.]